MAVRAMVIGGVALAAVGAGVLLWPREETPPPPPPSGVVVNSFADFQAALARGVKNSLQGETDVQVVPTAYQLPIGTLLIPKHTLAYDDRGCRPATTPEAYAVPTMFTSYKLSNGVAAGFDVGQGVIDGLGQAGASVDRGQSVALSFDDVKLAYLDQRALATVMASPECLAALGRSGTYMVVRGYFYGKRVYQLVAKDARAVSAGTQFGKLTVSRTPGNATIELADAQPVGFLALMTEVRVEPPAPAPAPATAPTPDAAAAQAAPSPDASPSPPVVAAAPEMLPDPSASSANAAQDLPHIVPRRRLSRTIVAASPPADAPAGSKSVLVVNTAALTARRLTFARPSAQDARASVAPLRP